MVQRSLNNGALVYDLAYDDENHLTGVSSEGLEVSYVYALQNVI